MEKKSLILFSAAPGRGFPGIPGPPGLPGSWWIPLSRERGMDGLPGIKGPMGPPGPQGYCDPTPCQSQGNKKG